MGLISPKLRQSAKGQDCTLQTPWCNHDPETTVLCHLPSDIAGMGSKSDDFHAVFGCAACHQALDQHLMSRGDTLWFSIRALQRTLRIWVEKGLVVVSGIDPDKPKTRPKKKANLPSRKLQSRPFGSKHAVWPSYSSAENDHD